MFNNTRRSVAPAQSSAVRRWVLVASSVSALLASAGAAIAQAPAPAKVLYSNISTSPTAQIPGAAPGTLFSGFRRPYPSPDGSKWIMAASNGSASAFNLLLLGNGNTATAAILPGAVTPWNPATNFVTFKRNAGINNAGQWAIGATDNSGSTTDALIIKNLGAGIVIHARETDPVFGALGGTGAQFAGTLDSTSIDDNGVVSFYSTLKNTTGGTGDDSAIWYGNTAVAQEGVTEPGNQPMGDNSLILSFRDTRYYRSPDGSTYIEGAQLNGSITRDQIIFVNGNIVAQEGVTLLSDCSQTLGNSSAGLGETNMGQGGDWFFRGNCGVFAGGAAEKFWVMRNGALVAEENQQIVPCAPERWARRSFTPNGFFTSIGDSANNYLVGGASDILDETFSGVLVLNGRRVVMRSNDPIDLDGNGQLDDNVFIRAFRFDDAFITPPPNRRLFVIVDLKDTQMVGNSIGVALVVKRIWDVCPADLDNDGAITVPDLFSYLDAWFATNGLTDACFPADVDGTQGVDVADLFLYLDLWFAQNGTQCE